MISFQNRLFIECCVLFYIGPFCLFSPSDSYKLKAALSEQLIVSVKGCGEMEGKETKRVEEGREILGK